MRQSGGLLDRLVAVCISLMVAAIALSVALSVIRPHLTQLLLIAGAVVTFSAWRAWQRSRW